MALVSLQAAKAHLRIPDDDTAHDADIELKRQAASDIIVDYLKAQADPLWDEDTAPGRVQSAVLLMLGNLYENRGEDMKADDATWQAVQRLLMRSRDPALA
jgi:hypothetical protein